VWLPSSARWWDFCVAHAVQGAAPELDLAFQPVALLLVLDELGDLDVAGGKKTRSSPTWSAVDANGDRHERVEHSPDPRRLILHPACDEQPSNPERALFGPLVDAGETLGEAALDGHEAHRRFVRSADDAATSLAGRPVPVCVAGDEQAHRVGMQPPEPFGRDAEYRRSLPTRRREIREDEQNPLRLIAVTR
jgi:hypothetical protein